MSSQENATDPTPTDDAEDGVAPADDAAATAPVKKAAAKKAAVKKAPAKKAASKKASSGPVIDWLNSWTKEAEPEELELLEEPVRAHLATRADLMPSVRKIVEADVDLEVRGAALTLFVDAEPGSELRNPANALEAAARRS